ncbi:MAG: hypothetical protein N3G20_10900, partial [Verrucomicrobiae bacterium]|nr:hypothetical protein [Verrucomicrobiae bacterium]
EVEHFMVWLRPIARGLDVYWSQVVLDREHIDDRIQNTALCEFGAFNRCDAGVGFPGPVIKDTPRY